jgi:spore maturation protein CgeB
MKILVYGECEQYGSGSWCYYESLKDMGHEVKFFSPFQGMERYKQLLFRVIKKLKNGGVLESDREKHIESFTRMAAAFKADIVIIIKGLLIDKNTVRKLKSAGSWVVLINHDDFFSQFKSSRSRYQLEAVPVYDFVFPTKEVNVLELKRLNSNTEFFPFAYYPRVHFPPQENSTDKTEWERDLVFIGNSYPERVKQMEYIVTNIKIPLRFKIFGYNWHKVSASSPLKPYIDGRTLVPEEMSKAIYYSKVTLGFLCKENRDDYTQRTFEIPACKGVLLAERTDRHLQYYEEGEEAEFFTSSDYKELLEKVHLLLTNDEQRDKIRLNGFSRVTTNHHTYADRLSRLIDLYYHAKKLKKVSVSN